MECRGVLNLVMTALTVTEEEDMSTKDAIAEEPVDVEEHAKAGKPLPEGRHFRIRIDKEKFVVEKPCMLGRELLTLAGKVPPEHFMLTQKFRGGKTKRIGLNEKTCFTEPGVERYMTLPLDQQEG